MYGNMKIYIYHCWLWLRNKVLSEACPKFYEAYFTFYDGVEEDMIHIFSNLFFCHVVCKELVGKA